MQVVGEGINRSLVEKRQFVTVLSHSRWNNRHADDYSEKYEEKHEGWTFEEMKTAFADSAAGGIAFIKIRDQNGGKDYRGFNTDSSAFDWIKSSPARHQPPYQPGSWDWLYSRLETCIKKAGKNFDPSDAGMIVYFLTGEEKTDPEMAREIMEHPILH